MNPYLKDLLTVSEAYPQLTGKLMLFYFLLCAKEKLVSTYEAEILEFLSLDREIGFVYHDLDNDCRQLEVSGIDTTFLRRCIGSARIYDDQLSRDVSFIFRRQRDRFFADLRLTRRVENLLRSRHVSSMVDLTQLRFDELMAIPGFGPVAALELVIALSERNDVIVPQDWIKGIEATGRRIS